MNTLLLSVADQQTLLKIARDSIQHGIEQGQAQAIDTSLYSGKLLDPGAAFVTLEKARQLRGCIGSIEAYRPLVEDVAENAWQAAFKDPRFSPLSTTEFLQLHIEISVLSQAEDMSFDSEEELKQQIVPERDGIIIRDGYHRAVFLPAVWEKLPEVDTFLAHLKQKAGLTKDYWSSSMTCQRFYCFEFGEEE